MIKPTRNILFGMGSVTGWTREEWSELVSEDPSAAEGYHAFNMAVREAAGSQADYAPMYDEMVREFLMCVNDANVALSHPPRGAFSERTLRTTVEVISDAARVAVQGG
ncbi:uncharacterized protein LOC123404602 [Hordeum vulgare subsp. vulgare]|uniref:uncharacterized protein LOC123404602 n=1 Tax=Hordeum vulgare subsp. vulgare TaxID=112509 RepID=UPI001D1A5B68|nr:uncharacterized protein LOC123404602 [Hordeum vulgare subsp. vulgare]